MVVDLYHNISAPAAVAPVGAAGRHIFLPVEGDHTVSPVARADGDLCGIYKRRCHLGHLLTLKSKFQQVQPHCIAELPPYLAIPHLEEQLQRGADGGGGQVAGMDLGILKTATLVITYLSY